MSDTVLIVDDSLTVRMDLAGAFEQAGFRPDQKQAFGGAHAGWGQFFGKLEQLLERGDQE